MEATNRQKKILNFFGIEFSPSISQGAAGWEIANLMEDEENREKWRRYVFLTQDFNCDSPEPKEFNAAELETIEVPEVWSASEAAKEFREEIVAKELKSSAPFDSPEPELQLAGCAFLFTGRFAFGSRKACQQAVIDRGGYAPSSRDITLEIDYLVIGNKGNTHWKRGSYGRKIESAVFSRRDSGKPSIISEDHWVSSLQNT